jgi:hypothetical protein
VLTSFTAAGFFCFSCPKPKPTAFGLDRSTYDHLRIAQQSQSIADAKRKYLSNQREAAIATFGLRPLAQ